MRVVMTQEKVPVSDCTQADNLIVQFHPGIQNIVGRVILFVSNYDNRFECFAETSTLDLHFRAHHLLLIKYVPPLH